MTRRMRLYRNRLSREEAEKIILEKQKQEEKEKEKEVKPKRKKKGE